MSQRETSQDPVAAVTQRLDELGVDLGTLETVDDARWGVTIAETLILEDAGDARPGVDAIAPLRDLLLREPLGQGGMGVVLAADQTTIGREVAVKTVREDRRSASADLDLLREAWVTGRLEHPNIIPIYALGVDEQRAPLFVMKRVEGVSWCDALDAPDQMPAYYDEEDPLDANLEIFEQVCRAAHFAHTRDILHRDIKPDNVMLGAFGEVYLVDWGIALSLDPERNPGLPTPQQMSCPAGTPCFMAPEMAVADMEAFDARTDVYLLGGLLHYVLTGQPPHVAGTLQATLVAAFASEPHDYDAARVPDLLARICHDAMHRDPAQRFASAEALRREVAEFRRYRASIEGDAQRPRAPPAPRADRDLRRRARRGRPRPRLSIVWGVPVRVHRGAGAMAS